jgi:hypothetical protein
MKKVFAIAIVLLSFGAFNAQSQTKSSNPYEYVGQAHNAGLEANYKILTSATSSEFADRKLIFSKMVATSNEFMTSWNNANPTQADVLLNAENTASLKSAFINRTLGVDYWRGVMNASNYSAKAKLYMKQLADIAVIFPAPTTVEELPTFQAKIVNAFATIEANAGVDGELTGENKVIILKMTAIGKASTQYWCTNVGKWADLNGQDSGAKLPRWLKGLISTVVGDVSGALTGGVIDAVAGSLTGALAFIE